MGSKYWEAMVVVADALGWEHHGNGEGVGSFVKLPHHGPMVSEGREDLMLFNAYAEAELARLCVELFTSNPRHCSREGTYRQTISGMFHGRQFIRSEEFDPRDARERAAACVILLANIVQSSTMATASEQRREAFHGT